MAIATAFCGLAFALVTNLINPMQTSIFGFILFYASLFLGLVGLFSLTGLGIRSWIHKGVDTFMYVTESFRQAVSFSMLLVLGLFFQSKMLLTWWNIIILIFLFAIIEMFFYSYKKDNPHSKEE